MSNTPDCHSLNLRLDAIESRVRSIEEGHIGQGYVCVLCKARRPQNWFIYEVDRESFWLRPCCAMCARENVARGPFKQRQIACR